MFHHDNYKQFAIVREEAASRVTLHVFGDVDLCTAGEVREAIDEVSTATWLAIDLTKCRYFDSSGLAVYARTLFGTRLTVIVSAKSQILRVMQIVSFHQLVNVVTELPTCSAV
jgi:anti-anti-sigma factor